jgi:heme-degrading monooxygenase HmoA
MPQEEFCRKPTMFVVIFEVQPKQERRDEYLGLAKQLKPELEAIDGFIDVERFESKGTKSRMLSLSTWRDEKSVVRWRTHGGHHQVQEKGRFEVFEDYHLRVGEVTADSHPPEGLALKQQRYDETEIGTAKSVTLTEITPDASAKLATNADALLRQLGCAPMPAGLTEIEVFESIYNAGKLAVLASWRDADAATAFAPKKFEDVASLRNRAVRVIRDYGMFERREAPQYYPAVEQSPEKAQRR